MEHVDINSPLALLLNSIAERALDLLGIEGDEFLEWLETAVAPEISEDAGRAATSDEGRLADSVDELDGVLLSALEEIGRLQGAELQGAVAEAALANLYYGGANPAERLSVFSQLGDLLTADRGYGFRVRTTETDRALLENWEDVLGWWMQSPGAPRPEPAQLRAWQRFVAENIEFRLGVATGAVVARAWSDGAGDPYAVPSLEAWRDTTGLPWFGFWARELLRWGTLDPFVAFALAQGLSRTREEASALRPAFQTWLGDRDADIESEDLIDPQLFLEWQRSLPRTERHAVAENTVGVQVVGTTGVRGMYRVIPVFAGETINWLDAAGYILAQSQTEGTPFQGRMHRDDYQLHTDVAEPYVSRVFASS